MSRLLLVVDRRSQEDLLLWPAVARALARRQPASAPPGPEPSDTPAGREPPAASPRPNPGLAILHAPGEWAERALEAAALPVRGEDGLLEAASEAARATLRRALVEENRRIAAVLTEEGVPAVGFVGSAMNLLGRPDAPWLADLVVRGVVPIVSASEAGADRVAEARLGPAAVHVARTLGATVVLLASGPSAQDGPIPTAASAGSLSDRSVLEACAGVGISVRVTDISGLAAPEPGRLVP